jgi:hypothetical protein
MRREVDNAALRFEREELADQCIAKLSRLRALLADLVLRELIVLSCRGLRQVGSRVGEDHLLAKQQGDSQQNANQDALTS